ncbi:MAG: PfkB family carbohydrate kinase, partial [Solirubrobacteraceae bacterium]
GRPHTPTGLFIGLTTFDVIHYVERFPAPDEKLQATSSWRGAGGPAANAAAAFVALGGRASLLTALGTDSLGRAAGEELAAQGVEVLDVCSGGAIAVSSVVVDGRGRRTVVSLNAGGSQAVSMPDRELELAVPDVVALDAHYPRLVAAILERAPFSGAPVVLDPGNWKPQLPALMPSAGHVIASAALAPDATADQILSRLARHRPVLAAVTAGAGPIRASVDGVPVQIDVPVMNAIDTLGAGDVLHGAYAFHLAAGAAPREALARGALIAARSCERQGPRLSPTEST